MKRRVPTLRSLRPGDRVPDNTELTPAQAEELTRRAVRLHDRRKDAVSLDVIRETLKAMGVAPDALEQAARELNAEFYGPPVARSPGEVLVDSLIFLIAAWPGITLLVFRERMLMDPWIPTGVGALLLALTVRAGIRSLRRRRRVLELEPEPVTGP